MNLFLSSADRGRNFTIIVFYYADHVISHPSSFTPLVIQNAHKLIHIRGTCGWGACVRARSFRRSEAWREHHPEIRLHRAGAWSAPRCHNTISAQNLWGQFSNLYFLDVDPPAKRERWVIWRNDEQFAPLEISCFNCMDTLRKKVVSSQNIQFYFVHGKLIWYNFHCSTEPNVIS